MHYTSSFSDFSLLQLRELLINGPDAKHHDNLQGTVFEDTENSQEQSAFTQCFFFRAFRGGNFPPPLSFEFPPQTITNFVCFLDIFHIFLSPQKQFPPPKTTSLEKTLLLPTDKMDIGVCLQTYQSCSFGLYYCVYLLLCASLRLLLQKM